MVFRRRRFISIKKCCLNMKRFIPKFQLTMPNMVMSQLPKCNHTEVWSRRRPKGNKTENILAINYMFVAIPKSKFMFYVRERLVYRSNVEVTYDEVFNYLADVCSDTSISLHYTINNQYVSITTTGQLHTFFQHLHNDPSMFLYIENKDYVWNVKPKNKKKKCQNRCANACLAQEGNEEEEKEEGEESSVQRKKKCPCTTCQESTDYDSESSDCSEETNETSDEGTIEAEENQAGEEEEEEEEDQVVPKCSSSPESSTGRAEGLLGEENDSDEQVTSDNEPAVSPKKHVPAKSNETVRENLKTFIMGIISKYDFESPSEKTLQPYCEAISRRLIHALWPPKITADTVVFEKSISILTFAVGTNLCLYFRDLYKTNASRDALFEKFIDSIISETHATVETQRQLNCMLGHIHTLKSLKPFCEKVKFDVEKMPKIGDIISTLQDTINALEITFSKVFTVEQLEGCPCVPSIKNYMKQLTSLISTLTELVDVKNRNMSLEKNLISAIDRITQTFIDNSCEKHSVWDDVIEEVDSKGTPGGETLKDKQKQILNEIEETLKSSGSTPEKEKVSSKKPKQLSAKTVAKVDEMMKNTSLHNYVYPPTPKAGAIMIPTGGLAHCQCKKNCEFLLNEPAYVYMDRFNEPKPTLLEKTKQKRFKKN